MQEEETMLNVFTQVQLSDGQIMPLEELIEDYERLRKEQLSKREITSELKVGQWFRIDREVIKKNKKEIQYKCKVVGEEGKKLWKRFEKSNKIADENPDQYPRFIETYIFEYNWDYITEQEMRDMCEEVGDGMCCEIICDLELQMRICNRESVNDLVEKADKLPYGRVIKFRNGDTGYFGGSTVFNVPFSSSHLYGSLFNPDSRYRRSMPYAFRRVL